MADYRFKNDLDYMPSNQPKVALVEHADFNPFQTSSPRDDLAKTEEAQKHKPRNLRGEVSLQQCDKTGLLQWRHRTMFLWKPVGSMFGINDIDQH